MGAEARDLGGVLVRVVGGRGRGGEGGDDQSVEADALQTYAVRKLAI